MRGKGEGSKRRMKVVEGKCRSYSVVKEGESKRVNESQSHSKLVGFSREREGARGRGGEMDEEDRGGGGENIGSSQTSLSMTGS